MRRVFIAIPLVIALLSSTMVQAQPGRNAPGEVPSYVAGPPAAPTTKTTSYRSHVILTDVALWLSIASLSDHGNEGMGTLLGLGLVLGGPAVHLAHGNSRGAAYSLLARAGLPIAGGLAGGLVCGDSEQDELFGCLGHVMIGVLLGYGTALVVDWTVLAEKKEVVYPTGYASIRPVLQLREGGAQAGIGFQF